MTSVISTNLVLRVFGALPKCAWDAARLKDSTSARLTWKHSHHQGYIKQKTLKGGCGKKIVFLAWKNVRDSFIIVLK